MQVVDRDIADAQVPGLSSDRQFLIAYEAALELATIPLYATGHETHGAGHHWLTFRGLPEVMGHEFDDLAVYFDTCRTKRNVGTYDRGGEISVTEAQELVEQVVGFRKILLAWLEQNHPELV